VNFALSMANPLTGLDALVHNGHLEMRIDIGPQSRASREMAMRQLKPAGKPALDQRMIKAKYSGNYQQILTQLLQQKDSLALTTAQIDSASKREQATKPIYFGF
jgi:hypothetical protein